MKGQEIKAEERDPIFGETSLKTNGSHWKPYLWRNHPWIRYLWRNLFENDRFSLETLSLEKSSLDTLSLKKPLWKQTVLIGNPIFGEIIP